jgi:hypothetical protein
MDQLHLQGRCLTVAFFRTTRRDAEAATLISGLGPSALEHVDRFGVRLIERRAGDELLHILDARALSPCGSRGMGVGGSRAVLHRGQGAVRPPGIARPLGAVRLQEHPPGLQLLTGTGFCTTMQLFHGGGPWISSLPAVGC